MQQCSFRIAVIHTEHSKLPTRWRLAEIDNKSPINSIRSKRKRPKVRHLVADQIRRSARIALAQTEGVQPVADTYRPVDEDRQV